MKHTSNLPQTKTEPIWDGLKLFLKTFIISYSIIFLAVMPAEYNYQKAIAEAMQTDGTDESIERAMYRHGFIVDAYNTNEPTLAEKLKALFNQPKY
jgi:hypothetical protein